MVALALLPAGCKTAAPLVNLPGGLFFVSEPLPNLTIPADVGGRSENPEDESGLIRGAFREAYTEAVLRGLNLQGVLGSDRVSAWPETAPESWNQNWANKESAPNSWGINNLVLALGNYEALSELSAFSGKEKVLAQVYTVSGPILDMYGRSAGYNRANGVTGYGFPLGEAFYSNGAAVQRFSRGRMIIAPEGSRFSFEDDLFSYMIESLEPEELENEFSGKNITADVRNAFIYAWAFTFSEREGISDGPIIKVSFSKPWGIEAGDKMISLKGFYYKSYNKSRDVLVLLETEDLPLRAHCLYGPFLKAILANKRLAGPDTEKKLGASAGNGLGRSLADGFAVYGPPLSDALPLPAAKIYNLTPEALGDSGDLDKENLFYEAQRFARGWIVAKYSDEPEIIWTEETEVEMEIETEEIAPAEQPE